MGCLDLRHPVIEKIKTGSDSRTNWRTINTLIDEIEPARLSISRIRALIAEMLDQRPGSGFLQAQLLDESADDFYECQYFTQNGLTAEAFSGRGATIYVAKPVPLRASLYDLQMFTYTFETDDGDGGITSADREVSYTYRSATFREATDGDIVQYETIIPRLAIGDIITCYTLGAAPHGLDPDGNPTPLRDPSGNPITLVALADGRAWSIVD